MDNAVFTYRWMAGGTDIDGATGSTYTLTADEVGTAISVWVSFTDDAGNPEAVTSAPHRSRGTQTSSDGAIPGHSGVP